MTQNHCLLLIQRSPSEHINETWQNLEMTWKKLSSEVLVSIIIDIVIDTTVLAVNLKIFSNYLLLGKRIFLNWICILTKGSWDVFLLFAFMWANRTGPIMCHVNRHLGEICSDFLVLATPKRQRHPYYLHVTLQYIWESPCFRGLWFSSLLSPFSVSPFSLCRMKIKICWVSLQSF